MAEVPYRAETAQKKVEVLEAENKRLREALERIIAEGGKFDQVGLKVRVNEIARAALHPEESE